MERNEMKIVAIIPARMNATRFPGKPIKNILNLPMIEHVRRRVLLCKRLAGVYVATCDDAIKEVVESSGGNVIMTSDSHERCTDRIAEAALQIDADVIVNVQGDEPLVVPEMIDAIVKPFYDDHDLQSVNLVSRIVDNNEFNDPNAPKVVTNLLGDILYISREPIPSRVKAPSDDFIRLKQLGLIAFRSNFLQMFTNLEPTPLEIVESVDMMRAIEHGYRVKAVEIEGKMIGVDIPSDIERVEKIIQFDPLLQKYC